MTAKIIQGPQSNESQRIGQLAISALHAQKPELWYLGQKAGDDYGIDYEALVFASLEDGGQFYIQIQLKGTTQSKHLSSDGTFISHEFSKRTLELWNNSASVVLIIIVDFTETEDPSKAPIYYEFVNETLDVLLPNIPADQKGITLRVPTSNKLNRTLDVIPIVGPYLKSIKESKAALRSLKEQPSSSPLANFATKVDTDEPIVFSMVQDNSDIKTVIETSRNAEQYRLHLNNLRSGNYASVIKAIKSPTISEIESDPADAGLRAYLLSKAYDETADRDQAKVLMKLASRLIPNNDEILAGTYQHELENIKLGKEGEAGRDALLDEIEQFEGPYIASIKARLLAMSGKFEDAREIIKGLSHEKVGITIPTISIIERNWQRSIDEIDEILSSDILQAKARFWLTVLKSRAYFELALRDVPRREDEAFSVPSSGLPEIHLDEMKLAYETSLQAFKEAQRLNWPFNAEYLVDIFVISSMMLDRMESSLTLVSEFLYEKPYLTETRELVSRLAIQFGSPRIALKLAELSADLPKFENQDLMVIIATHAKGSASEAFRLFKEDVLNSSVKNEVYFSSLLILGIAADRSFQSNILERIRNELSGNELGSPYLAILNCAIKVNHSQLKKIDALIELKDYWLECGRPYQIALHILDNLYPLDSTEAKLAVEICEIYLTKNCLPVEHSLVYSHALLTLGEHEKAIAFLESTIVRYPDNNDAKSLLGIALEVNGQSERAFTLIQNLLQDGYASDNARQYFCNIAIRMGYFDIAESQLRSALSSAKSQNVQISILQTLIRLLFSIKDRFEEIPYLAWEFGKLIDQNNEIQEALFLQFYLMATSSPNISVDAAQREEFQRRMRAFTETFPDSKILWTAQLPDDGTPGDLLDAIKEAVGITDESLQQNEAVIRTLDSGKVAVPFSWRPRHFLRNVGEVFTLWELNKNTSEDRQAYHLTCYPNGDPVNTPDINEKNELVISLVSLIILNEVGLLETVLNCFSKVVIARNVLMRLQASRSMLATIVEHKIASEILEVLQRNFSKIIHPPMVSIDEDHFIPWHIEEREAMRNESRIYMCDDIIESILVCQAEKENLSRKRITTLDFLHWAVEKKHILQEEEAATYIAKLCSLKLGHVIVRQRYLVASIPKALQDASSDAEELKAFEEATTLNTILNGIWSYGKSFEELSVHFAFNIAYLVNEGNANIPVITSLWSRWVQAIRFNTENEFTIKQRIYMSFIRILLILPKEANPIKKLWAALWVTLKRCCESELSEPEDIEAVKTVAGMLGRVRGRDDNQTVNVGDEFTKALMGLEVGTQLYESFNKAFVDGAAEAAIMDMQDHNRGY